MSMYKEDKENVYKKLLCNLNSGKKAVLITRNFQSKSLLVCLTEEDLFGSQNGSENSFYNPKNVDIEKAQEALISGHLKYIYNQEQELMVVEPFFPEPRLIVLGGGHIAKPLVEFSKKVGFRVTVIDDRLSFANAGRFPLAENVFCESFENCFKLFKLNASSFVVIVTRGHKHDMFCLKETLKYDTAYVGMIGSKRRIKIVNEQLLLEGYTQEQIQKVNAPIGFDIDAVTPEEIAVSILAQLISCRRKNRRTADGTFARVNWPEFDGDVIEELAKNKKEPKALATIISTKGSTPRKKGAKMLVYPDGRTLGSIGGGCGEMEVILSARDIIKSGGYLIQRIDMTGYVAEDEGMVCGGIMEVLIEFCE